MLANGTLVKLPDGTEAVCYRERSGTYATVQTLDGVVRRDYGWQESFLTPVADERAPVDDGMVAL